jgi:phosphoribosylformylglycinamidine synthase PurS subunit
MTRFPVLVEIRLREGIADPQGATIERSLPALGFEGVADVQVGKAIRLTIEADDAESAQARVQQLCDRLLSNPVIENAAVTVIAPKANA